MKLKNQALSFDNSIAKLPYSICIGVIPHRVALSTHSSPFLDTMTDPCNSQIQTVIQTIHETSLGQLQAAADELIPCNLMPPAEFIQALSLTERMIVFKACLIVFVLSENTMVPRQLQLQAALAEFAGFDSNVISGTGSGKTLAIAILHILLPDWVSFIISPLNQLQVTQVCSILQLFMLGGMHVMCDVILRSEPLSDGVLRQLQ
jgi:hypothetical protein